ncbi:MAG: hypothetical protein QXR96_03575 [Candidatus Woesearchaeota archaeon]
MKSIIFDSGPLITLSLNNLLWLLKPLKEKYKGEFYITKSVKKEIIDKPLESKKFKFEAIQILKLVEEGTLKIIEDKKIKIKADYLFSEINSFFMAHNTQIKVVHYAEIETLSAGLVLNSDAVVIDEFIMRNIVENPKLVHERLENKLHMIVSANNEKIKVIKEKININILRTFELVIAAYEMNLFKEYYLKIENSKKQLLEALLWGIKLNGCSISEEDIREAMKIEKVEV